MRRLVAWTVAGLFACPIIMWTAVVGVYLERGLPLELIAQTLVRTHTMAAIVSALAVAIAAPAVILASLRPSRVATIIRALIFAPLCVGMLARNYAWIGMLSERSAVTSLGWAVFGGPRLLYTNAAVTLVMAFVFLPWTYFVLEIGLGALLPIHFESAWTLGATDAAIVRRVLLPLMARPAVVAFTLTYCTALGYFITPRMVGSNRGDVASSVVINFMRLSGFGPSSEMGAYLLVSCLPFSLAFAMLLTRRDSIFSWSA